jgi:hypothetical protein
MSVKVMAAVWDFKGLSSTQKMILLAYADHADHEGRNIFPSVELIARKTEFNRRTVQRVTRELQALRIIVDDGKGAKGTRKWAISLGRLGGGPVSPPDDEGAVLSTRGAVLSAQGGGPVPPEPSVTISNHHIDEATTKPKTKPYTVFLEWCRLQSFDPARVTRGQKNRELKHAKDLLEVGWTLKEISGCLEDVLAEEFWQGKTVSLSFVERKINAWHQSGENSRAIRM